MVLELGYANLSRFKLADVWRPHLDELARSLGASAAAVLEGTDIRYVSRSDLASRMSVSLRPGSRLPAHVTAAGNVILTALDATAGRCRTRVSKSACGPLRSRSGLDVGALTVSVLESTEPTSVLVARCLPPLLETAGKVSLELRAGIDLTG
ncbi:hypothetical protein RBB84_17415 [Rhodococcus sp. D-6]|uniref:IclR-ED domain-containing protein n=1 Tax=Rhodococcus sp. D-6 TaxID=1387842 RepID=A0AAU7UTG5_9NOCA|nr:hypothetical protein [Rhodococcus sp. HS-D2]